MAMVVAETTSVTETLIQSTKATKSMTAAGRTIFQPNRVLFVSNIPFEKRDVQTIKTLFTPYGFVEKVRLGISEDGYFRGFAHS